VLTVLKAYSSWRSVPTLLLDDTGRAETDLLQIRNIDGIDPVKAAVNTSMLGSVDGAALVGSSVASRNIVLTVHPNPDWDIWSFEALRRLIYSYFMPKKPVRLVFESDDLIPVEISGVVESVTINPFSKDQEFLVSVICPDPYFTAVEPVVLTGPTVTVPDEGTLIDYKGNIEAGINVRVSWTVDPSPSDIGIQLGDPRVSYFAVLATVNETMYFEMNSIPMRKYVQNVNIGTGVINNLLSKVHVQEGSAWPTLQPGENVFYVITDEGVQDWQLTYFERFGGL
jgi:phage-related protein